MLLSTKKLGKSIQMYQGSLLTVQLMSLTAGTNPTFTSTHANEEQKATAQANSVCIKLENSPDL